MRGPVSFRRSLLWVATAVALVAAGFGLGVSRPALGTESTGATVPAAAASVDTSSCLTMNLYAEQLPDSPNGEVRLGFGLTPDTASIPGPLVTLYESQCLRVTLTDDIPTRVLKALRAQYGEYDLPLGVSVHPHGVRYPNSSDGTAMTHSIVGPGRSRTYTWIAAPGTAGYWWYHDHNIGTDHGTGGMAAGLFGGLIVRRSGDPLPSVPTFVVAFGDNATINLQRWPNTPQFTATEGQRVEWLVFDWGNDFHVFHLHAHSWGDNRTGAIDPNDTNQRVVDAIGLGPSQSFGFQVIAGAVSGPGDWMYHCHVQAHSDAGMWNIFRVLPASGA